MVFLKFCLLNQVTLLPIGFLQLAGQSDTSTKNESANMSSLVLQDMESSLSCTPWASQALWLGMELFYGKHLHSMRRTFMPSSIPKPEASGLWSIPTILWGWRGAPRRCAPPLTPPSEHSCFSLSTDSCVSASPQDTVSSTEGPRTKSTF